MIHIIYFFYIVFGTNTRYIKLHNRGWIFLFYHIFSFIYTCIFMWVAKFSERFINFPLEFMRASLNLHFVRF